MDKKAVISVLRVLAENLQNRANKLERQGASISPYVNGLSIRYSGKVCVAQDEIDSDKFNTFTLNVEIGRLDTSKPIQERRTDGTPGSSEPRGGREACEIGAD